MYTSPQLSAALSPHTYYILLALYDQPLHGYGIMSRVNEDSAGAVVIQSATMYRALNRLIRDRLIEEVPSPSTQTPGKDRRSYTLTERGRAAFRLELDRLKRAATLGHQQVHGPSLWRAHSLGQVVK